MGQTQVDVRQRPCYKAVVLSTALQPNSATCPRTGVWYIPAIYLVYTWYIPGMTFHSLFQQNKSYDSSWRLGFDCWYTRILYYVYTLYIPRINIVYPKNILYIYQIYNVYTVHILCIYLVYTSIYEG